MALSVQPSARFELREDWKADVESEAPTPSSVQEDGSDLSLAKAQTAAKKKHFILFAKLIIGMEESSGVTLIESQRDILRIDTLTVALSDSVSGRPTVSSVPRD